MMDNGSSDNFLPVIIPLRASKIKQMIISLNTNIKKTFMPEIKKHALK